MIKYNFTFYLLIDLCREFIILKFQEYFEMYTKDFSKILMKLLLVTAFLLFVVILLLIFRTHIDFSQKKIFSIGFFDGKISINTPLNFSKVVSYGKVKNPELDPSLLYMYKGKNFFEYQSFLCIVKNLTNVSKIEISGRIKGLDVNDILLLDAFFVDELNKTETNGFKSHYYNWLSFGICPIYCQEIREEYYDVKRIIDLDHFGFKGDYIIFAIRVDNRINSWQPPNSENIEIERFEIKDLGKNKTLCKLWTES